MRETLEVLTIDQSTLSCRMAEMPDEWKGIEIINTPGGPQQMATLKEPGLPGPHPKKGTCWASIPNIRTGCIGKSQCSTLNALSSNGLRCIEISQHSTPLKTGQQSKAAGSNTGSGGFGLFGGLPI